MKKYLVLVFGIILIGCNETPEDVARYHDSYIGQYIRYVKDHRTGFCFAYDGVSGGRAYTLVPCTPEVLKLCKNCRENSNK